MLQVINEYKEILKVKDHKERKQHSEDVKDLIKQKYKNHKKKRIDDMVELAQTAGEAGIGITIDTISEDYPRAVKRLEHAN